MSASTPETGIQTDFQALSIQVSEWQTDLKIEIV